VNVSPDEVVFTKNATEGINLVAYALSNAATAGPESARFVLGPGDEIVVTEMEHHANLVPWQELCRRTGATLRWLSVDDDGRLDLEALPRLLADGKVKLVGVVHISNVLGTINPIEEIARQAHTAGSVVLVDASQSVPHRRMEVLRLGADFMAFTGHKMLGPTGIGVLWARRTLLEQMPPFLGGGEMIREVSLRSSKWNELPWKFEAGTMAIAEAVGLGAAVDYLQGLGMDAVFSHDQELVEYAMERLTEVPGLKILGPPAKERGGVVAFTMEGIHPHDIATVLDRQGVAIRAGHHCAMPLHEKLGIPASARASFYCYTVREEIDQLIAGLHKTRSLFKQ